MFKVGKVRERVINADLHSLYGGWDGGFCFVSRAMEDVFDRSPVGALSGNSLRFLWASVKSEPFHAIAHDHEAHHYQTATSSTLAPNARRSALASLSGNASIKSHTSAFLFATPWRITNTNK